MGCKRPQHKKTRTGTSGKIDDQDCWESEVENVGMGCQTVTKIEAPNLLETKLEFKTPYESEALGYIKLAEETGGTNTTWGFESTMPYPFRLMKLFMNMEEEMDKEFGAGLNSLKGLAEASQAKLEAAEKVKALELVK